MTPEQRVVADIHAAIERIPDETQRAAIHRTAQELREWLKSNGDGARVAFALVGAEMAALMDG